MSISEQAAILLEATKREFLQPEDIVRWADATIVAAEKPAAWLIQVSILNSPYMADYTPILREQAVPELALHRQIQIIVLAQDAGLLSFRETLPKLFQILIIDRFHRNEHSLDYLDERLKESLVEWDSQENLDVIEPSLQRKFLAMFREYLSDANEVAAVLPWILKKAA
jgi:hypothetical protein